jgi:ankyrin repeat protein
MQDIFPPVRAGNVEEVMRLLDADSTLLERQHTDGRRLLVVAAEEGQLGVVTLVIERGADIHARDRQGCTALWYAASEGHEDVTTFLLAEGAQASTANASGITPLMEACANGHLDVVQILVQHTGGKGLDVKDKDDGWTALHHAADGGNDEVVRLLLLSGADLRSMDNWGRTPRALAEINYEEEAYEDDEEEGCEEDKDWELIEDLKRCVALFKVSCWIRKQMKRALSGDSMTSQ